MKKLLVGIVLGVVLFIGITVLAKSNLTDRGKIMRTEAVSVVKLFWATDTGSYFTRITDSKNTCYLYDSRPGMLTMSCVKN